MNNIDIDILEKFCEIKINSYAMKFVDISYPDLQQAISNLIAENKELKEEKEKAFKEGYIKGIQPQILENWNNEQARIVKVKSQFVPISLIEKKIEELSGMVEVGDITREMFNRNEYAIEVLLELLNERSNTDE